jgi:flagellar biosynthesis protein FliQ
VHTSDTLGTALATLELKIIHVMLLSMIQAAVSDKNGLSLDYITNVLVVVRALPLVYKLFLQLLPHYIYCRAKNNWCDCDERSLEQHAIDI